ncbi:MAG: SAM-dependent DNA methyltransferase [Nitrosomonas sp.]|uniref:N-6 DNA methylase n=1 Tax=Nitrosomonas sp. TaxID=42353 RepID=UPI0032EE88F5
MAQLENIEAIEKRLWGSADNLRANSNYASNEYFMPVMGLIFLRHAYSRYLAVKPQIEATLPSRGGVTRPLTKEDFSSKGAIFLQEKAQFDSLVNLTDADDRAQAVIDAMEAIEADYETLKGILPKSEYQELDNDVLGNLLRTFNDPALKKATGDIFGRIYEYFLTQFANQSAHDGGEFFTPVSLVQMIVNFIEPDHGSVIDPACGSGGMFVQSAHFIEKMHKNPQDVATFYGAEKNPTTIRLAKMNLAVHGLEGKIQKAISYYEDPHDFLGKADFVMANPPFNVDDVDAEKIKNDPRLPFGLPGVNKKGAVSNGNYLWISYFYSYLNKEGRAGFVMSSQASSAGGQEAEVRRKLVESGHVEGMIAIRSNFFYTRSVPCELWFLNKSKPAGMKDKVLMLDARNVYRKVTRKIYDFSPEQLANLTSIVWLYRGQKDRFLALVESYLTRTLEDAKAAKPSMDAFIASFDKLASKLEKVEEETSKAFELLTSDIKTFENTIEAENRDWEKAPRGNAGLLSAAQKLEPMAETSRDLIKQIDQLYKLIEKQAKQSAEKGLNKLIKEFDDERKEAVEQLKQVRYIFKQAHWLQERFPDATLRDVEGLVKLVDIAEIKANDWSLTPGRYVGVAPEEEDEDFDFEETLRDIHIELKGLNDEAVLLAAQIQKNFEELGI